MLGALVLRYQATVHQRIIGHGVKNRDLADVAHDRQAFLEETFAFPVQFSPVFIAWTVHGIEQFTVLGRKPVQLLLGRYPGIQGRGMGKLVNGAPELMGDTVFFLGGHFMILGRPQTVTGQVVEQGHPALLPVDLPGLAPGHHLLGQHVVHHGAHQPEQAVAAPEPFVQPLLYDGQVAFVLFQHELDDLEPQGHVARLIGLGREAESGRRHVAVVGGAGHERHEQQVGQYVFKGK